MSWCMRWSVMVLPKPRSAIFRPQIQEFQGSISDSESGQFPLSLGTASPVSALCFGEERAQHVGGSCAFGPWGWSRATGLFYWTVQADTVSGACEVVLAQRWLHSSAPPHGASHCPAMHSYQDPPGCSQCPEHNAHSSQASAGESMLRSEHGALPSPASSHHSGLTGF